MDQPRFKSIFLTVLLFYALLHNVSSLNECQVFFGNGDVKKTLPDGVVVYTYGETKTIHTTHPNGLSVIEFPNGQVEKHLPDGSQEIVFPDQTFKCFA
jgi:hypothetical protein